MKFKNAKNKAKKSKSPSNSRTIPVTLLKIYRGSLKVFLILIFILTGIIVGMDLQKNLTLKDNIDSQRQKISQDLKFWESFIEKHKVYRDAYFQASILEYKLGDTNKAKMYVKKGLVLDPNSENGKKIEDFLVNK